MTGKSQPEAVGRRKTRPFTAVQLPIFDLQVRTVSYPTAIDQETPVHASRATRRFLRNRTFSSHSCELASRPRLIKHSCCSSQSYRTWGVILTVREPMASRGCCMRQNVSVLSFDERDLRSQAR